MSMMCGPLNKSPIYFVLMSTVKVEKKTDNQNTFNNSRISPLCEILIGQSLFLDTGALAAPFTLEIKLCATHTSNLM